MYILLIVHAKAKSQQSDQYMPRRFQTALWTRPILYSASDKNIFAYYKTQKIHTNASLICHNAILILQWWGCVKTAVFNLWVDTLMGFTLRFSRDQPEPSEICKQVVSLGTYWDDHQIIQPKIDLTSMAITKSWIKSLQSHPVFPFPSTYNYERGTGFSTLLVLLLNLCLPGKLKLLLLLLLLNCHL